MKNHINFVKNLQFVISIALIFVLSANSLIAQSPKEMEDRIAEIDNEIYRLTNKNEASSFALQDISKFSKNARVFLDKKSAYEKDYEELMKKRKQFEDLLNKKEEDVDEESKYLWERKWLIKDNMDDFLSRAEAKQKLLRELDSEFRKKGGMLSYSDYQCNNLDALQKEYNESISDYNFLKKEYDNANYKLNNLHLERQKLVNELALRKSNFDKKKQFLEGCWVLKIEESSSVISIHEASTSGEFVGVLRVNELDGYDDGQKMFTVYRISHNSFQGDEYIWSEPDRTTGISHKKSINAIIKINPDGKSLTWTSDQTVTMTRCR